MNRRGMGFGRGSGYYNIAPMDSHIHSLSAKGVKTFKIGFNGITNVKAKSIEQAQNKVWDMLPRKEIISSEAEVVERDDKGYKVKFQGSISVKAKSREDAQNKAWDKMPENSYVDLNAKGKIGVVRIKKGVKIETYPVNSVEHYNEIKKDAKRYGWKVLDAKGKKDWVDRLYGHKTSKKTKFVTKGVVYTAGALALLGASSKVLSAKGKYRTLLNRASKVTLKTEWKDLNYNEKTYIRAGVDRMLAKDYSQGGYGGKFKKYILEGGHMPSPIK